MVTGFIHIEDAYKDYLQHQVDGVELPTQRFAYAVINDTVDKLLRGDNYVPLLAFIEIKDNMGKLPKGVREIFQAGYIKHHRPIKRSVIRDYIQYNLGDPCKLIVSVECNNCHKTECECGDLLYKINLDPADYPELGLRNYPALSGYSSPDPYHPHQGFCGYYPGFKLMRPKQGSFFNAKFRTKNCAPLNFDTAIEYDFRPPNLEVNFEKGMVLLAYKGAMLADGFLMVPDTPKVAAAIRASIDFNWDYARTRAKLDNETRARLEISRKQKDDTEYEAISELSSIPSDRWDSITTQLNELIPRNGFENMYNHGQDFGAFEDYLR